MTPTELLQRVRKIDVNTAAQQAIQNTATQLIDVVQEQLFQGIGKDDKQVSPSYAPRTIAIKRKKGQPFDRVTRKDTGSYYAGIGIEVTGDKFYTESSDSKAPDLNKKYGGIGLAPSYNQRYIVTLRPELLRVIKKQMGA